VREIERTIIVRNVRTGGLFNIEKLVWEMRKDVPICDNIRKTIPSMQRNIEEGRQDENLPREEQETIIPNIPKG